MKMISAKNAAFITAKDNPNRFDCLNNTGPQSVAAGNSISINIPPQKLSAGIYNLNIYISATQDMAGALDNRSYALVVNP